MALPAGALRVMCADGSEAVAPAALVSRSALLEGALEAQGEGVGADVAEADVARVPCPGISDKAALALCVAVDAAVDAARPAPVERGGAATDALEAAGALRDRASEAPPAPRLKRRAQPQLLRKALDLGVVVGALRAADFLGLDETHDALCWAAAKAVMSDACAAAKEEEPVGILSDSDSLRVDVAASARALLGLPMDVTDKDAQSALELYATAAGAAGGSENEATSPAAAAPPAAHPSPSLLELAEHSQLEVLAYLMAEEMSPLAQYNLGSMRWREATTVGAAACRATLALCASGDDRSGVWARRLKARAPYYVALWRGDVRSPRAQYLSFLALQAHTVTHEALLAELRNGLRHALAQDPPLTAPQLSHLSGVVQRYSELRATKQQLSTDKGNQATCYDACKQAVADWCGQKLAEGIKSIEELRERWTHLVSASRQIAALAHYVDRWYVTRHDLQRVLPMLQETAREALLAPLKASLGEDAVNTVITSFEAPAGGSGEASGSGASEVDDVLLMQSTDDRLVRLPRAAVLANCAAVAMIVRASAASTGASGAGGSGSADGGNQVAPLPVNCTAAELEYIGTLCTALERKRRSPASAAEEAMPEIQFIMEHFRDANGLGTNELFAYILVGNTLNFKVFLDAACRDVANMIKGKTPDEIKATFNVKDDLTAAEEEELRLANAWAFE